MSEIATYDLGRIGLNIRGPYEGTANYEELDIVNYNYSSYVAKRANSGVVPGENDDWSLLTQGVIASYPAAEQKTGEVWVDGKPIYRKVLTYLANSTAGGDRIVNIGAPVKMIIRMYGGHIGASNGVFYSLPYIPPSDITYGIRLYASDLNTSDPKVVIDAGSGTAIRGDGFVVVEYTKTTD